MIRSLLLPGRLATRSKQRLRTLLGGGAALRWGRAHQPVLCAAHNRPDAWCPGRSDVEDATLQKMRQAAERQRLIAEMEQEEAGPGS